MSLGDLLAARIERDAAAERAKQEAEERAAQAEKKRKLDIISNYFEKAKQAITDAIMADQPLPHITLSKRGGWAYDSYEIAEILESYRWGSTGYAQPTGIYVDIWQSFEKWAESNQLKVQFEYEHNGMDASWYVLTVRPLHS
jgi:hypothetical protein